MVTPRRESLPSPSLEEPFFSLFSSSTLSLMTPPTPEGMEGNGGMETDLILAAELGRALLERNEELTATLEEREREIESLQQEKHSLQRKVEMSDLALGQKEAELTYDLTALRAELERHHGQGRNRRKDESEQLTQLANHNHRLVEQLAEAVTLEHTLRTELRGLREEMEETDFNRNISHSQLDNIQAENRVLQERLARMDKQLKASQEDSEKLRVEREGLRENLTDLLDKLREKEAELEEEQGTVFELRSLNRSLQQRALQDLVEENGFGSSHMIQPLSLLSEIQQSQAKDVLLSHSAALQARDQEIQALKQQLQSQLEELESLKEQLKSFGYGPGAPSYSSLEKELVVVRQERDSLTQQLYNTIQHKVALSQEVDAWQEDMRLVINQQVQQREEERQREKEKEKEMEKTTGLQRSKSLRLRGNGGFFSSLFKDK